MGGYLGAPLGPGPPGGPGDTRMLVTGAPLTVADHPQHTQVQLPQAGSDPGVQRVRSPTVALRQLRRRRWLIAILVVLLLGMAAAAGGWWLGGRWAALRLGGRG